MPESAWLAQTNFFYEEKMAFNFVSMNVTEIIVGNNSYLNVTGLNITALTGIFSYTLLNLTGLVNFTTPSPNPDSVNPDSTNFGYTCVPNSDMAGIGASTHTWIATNV